MPYCVINRSGANLLTSILKYKQLFARKVSFDSYFRLLLFLTTALSALNSSKATEEENLFVKFREFNPAVKLNIEVNENFITKEGISIYTLRSKNAKVQYIELHNDDADSTFINEYRKHCFKQSCSIVNKNESSFFNFRYGQFTYILVPCMTCSDYFSDDCFKMKKSFNIFLNKCGVVKLTF